MGWAGGMGWLRCPADPFGDAVCGDHVQYPAFAPSTSEVAVRFRPFCILLFIICMQLFLVPCSFFVFCCSRERLSRCKCSSKGSQVPDYLISTRCHHGQEVGRQEVINMRQEGLKNRNQNVQQPHPHLL